MVALFCLLMAGKVVGEQIAKPAFVPVLSFNHRVYDRGRKMKKTPFLKSLHIRGLYCLAAVLFALSLAAPAMAAPEPKPQIDQATGLLATRFGVTLRLQPPHSGGLYNSFDWDSFQPTLNTGTVDYTEGDWYGNWSESDVSFTTFSTRPHRHCSPGRFPSGGEWYMWKDLF